MIATGYKWLGKFICCIDSAEFAQMAKCTLHYTVNCSNRNMHHLDSRFPQALALNNQARKGDAETALNDLQQLSRL